MATICPQHQLISEFRTADKPVGERKFNGERSWCYSTGPAGMWTGLECGSGVRYAGTSSRDGHRRDRRFQHRKRRRSPATTAAALSPGISPLSVGLLRSTWAGDANGSVGRTATARGEGQLVVKLSAHAVQPVTACDLPDGAALRPPSGQWRPGGRSESGISASISGESNKDLAKPTVSLRFIVGFAAE